MWDMKYNIQLQDLNNQLTTRVHVILAYLITAKVTAIKAAGTAASSSYAPSILQVTMHTYLITLFLQYNANNHILDGALYMLANCFSMW